MDSLVRLLQQLRSSKPSKDEANHVERSNSFTVQMSPTFYQHRQRQNEMKSPLPVFLETPKRSDALNSQDVNYIFSAEIGNVNRPTCLKMLQEPLKEVYLSYASRRSSSTPCVIENVSNGLRFRYLKPDGSTSVEVFNEFHTIAYWAAVRCVVINSSLSTSGLQIGFFPFTESGQCVIQEYSTEGFLQIDDQHANLLQKSHPPLFACVMRNSVTSVLHCHVFLCDDSRQAISLAAKLYESLKANLSSKLNFQSDQNNESAQSSSTSKLFKSDEMKTNCQSSLNGQLKSSDQLHSHHPAAKRKYSTIVCSSCKRKPNAANRRSTSFSAILSRLRRLAVHKNNETDQPLRRRLSNHKKSVSNINGHLVPTPRRKHKQLVEDNFLDVHKQRLQYDDCDAGYHSIPPRSNEQKPQLINISMATPPWMKMLMDGDFKNCTSGRKKCDAAPSLKRSSFLFGNSSKSLGSFASDKIFNNSEGFSDNGSAYEEIEETDVSSLFESKSCSVVDEANLSSSEDEDDLTEVDSLESSSSWKRSKTRKLQIETINRMLGLTQSRNKTRSLSDIFFKGSGNFKQSHWSDEQKLMSGAKMKLEKELPVEKESGNYVKKDAEIVYTLEEILKPIRPPRNSDIQHLQNRISVSKPYVELELTESELMENDRKLSEECNWGWASFLP